MLHGAATSRQAVPERLKVRKGQVRMVRIRKIDVSAQTSNPVPAGSLLLYYFVGE